MLARIRPGGSVGGEAVVPGDKSIAHRWLILAATADGRGTLHDLPVSLDVRSTAGCLALIAPSARPSLETWASGPAELGKADGFTWDAGGDTLHRPEVRVEGEGRDGLRGASRPLDCGNSGTTMRLLSGVLGAAPFASVLTGDESLRARPMERVAAPLREMGASIRSTAGHAPLEIRGARLHGIRHAPSVPSAQVKGAILLAGLSASGETTVEEAVPTRDHTERALAHLGAPVRVRSGSVTVSAFQHGGFEARVPGDLSSAAFLAAAAALTRGHLVVHGVGLNPSRMRFLDVFARMGIRTEHHVIGDQLGEPVGELVVLPGSRLVGTTVDEAELPLVIDEVPVLAAVAAHAAGETWFAGAAELRVKESDRLAGLAASIRALGGHAVVEREDLIVAGGGLRGGAVASGGDHRMAMAMAVAALVAEGACVIDGIEAADVSFPGFVGGLRSLGARIED